MTAPRVKVSMPKRRALRKLLKRGIAFRVSCSEPCRVTVRLTARIRGRDVVLAKVRRILEADRRVRVVVKLKPRAARRLRRADPSRVKLGITAMDIARNTRTVTRRVRLTG